MTRFNEGELEALSYNEIVKLAKENSITVFRKKKVYLIRKLLALNKLHRLDNTQNESRYLEDAENFADLSGPEVFDKENKLKEKVETRRSVLIYKPSGIIDEETNVADNKRQSTFDVKSSEVVDKQNQLNNITTRRSLFKEKQILAFADLNSKASGEEYFELLPKEQNSIKVELPPDIPNWVKKGTEVKRETRRSTFLVKAQNSAKKDRTSLLNDTGIEDSILNGTVILDTSDVPNWAKGGTEINRETRRSTFLVKPHPLDIPSEPLKNIDQETAEAAMNEAVNTRRSTFVIKPTDNIDKLAEVPLETASARRSTCTVKSTDNIDKQAKVPVETANIRRSNCAVKPTEEERGNKVSRLNQSAIEENKLNSTINLGSSAIGESLNNSTLHEISVAQRKPKRSGTFIIDSPRLVRHGVSFRANQTLTTILEPLDETEELLATLKSSPESPSPELAAKRKSVQSSSVAIEDKTIEGRQTRRSLLNRSATFVVDSPAVGSTLINGRLQHEASATQKKPERSGTFVVDSSKETKELLATPKRLPGNRLQPTTDRKTRQSFTAINDSSIADKENIHNLVKTPKLNDSAKRATAKENAKVAVPRVPGSARKVVKHRPVIRTPMSVKKQPKTAENKTPRSKSAVKQPWNSGLKAKMPDFNAIHKRQFDRMESLVDNVKRKELRTIQLFSPPTANSRKTPTLKPTRQKTIVMDSSVPAQNKARSKSFIPVPVSKGSAPGQGNADKRLSLASKLPPASVENTRQKERNNIRGVRANRRFLLQMEMRNIK